MNSNLHPSSQSQILSAEWAGKTIYVCLNGERIKTYKYDTYLEAKVRYMYFYEHGGHDHAPGEDCFLDLE